MPSRTSACAKRSPRVLVRVHRSAARAAPRSRQRIRDAFVVPAGWAGRGAAATTPARMCSSTFSPRTAAASMIRRCAGVRAASKPLMTTARSAERLSGPYGGHQQGQAAGALVHVGRRSRIDQLSDLIDGKRRKRERHGAVPAEVGETDGDVLHRGRPHGANDREAGAALRPLRRGRAGPGRQRRPSAGLRAPPRASRPRSARLAHPGEHGEPVISPRPARYRVRGRSRCRPLQGGAPWPQGGAVRRGRSRGRLPARWCAGRPRRRAGLADACFLLFSRTPPARRPWAARWAARASSSPPRPTNATPGATADTPLVSRRRAYRDSVPRFSGGTDVLSWSASEAGGHGYLRTRTAQCPPGQDRVGG